MRTCNECGAEYSDDSQNIFCTTKENCSSSGFAMFCNGAVLPLPQAKSAQCPLCLDTNKVLLGSGDVIKCPRGHQPGGQKA